MGEAVRETLGCLSARLGMPGESQIRAGLGLWISARQVAASCRCFHKEPLRQNVQPTGCNLSQVCPIPHPNT